MNESPLERNKLPIATVEHSNISGIGDYLNALNHALHLCSILDIGYRHTPSKLPSRTGHSNIDDFIGLTSLEEAPSIRFDLTLSFREAYTIALSKDSRNSIAGKNIKLVFRSDDYSEGEFFSAVRRDMGISGYAPALVHILGKSPMYSHYLLRKKRDGDNGAKRVVVHARRGDIAFAPLSLLKSALKRKSHEDSYYFPITNQIVSTDISPADLHQGFRYIDNAKILRAISEFKSGFTSDSFFVLVSDGFTQASKGIAMHHSSLLSEAVNASFIENLLNEDLREIKAQCCNSIIGETPENLEKSLVEFLLADYVIHGPSCFPLTIRRMAGLDEPLSIALS